jgi:helix-turn-helix protein
MRYARVPESIYRDQRISNGQLRVLVCLIGFADRDGGCNPSLRAIAGELSRTRATIRHHLQKLVELRVITRDPRPRKDGSRGANRYTIPDLRYVAAGEMPAPERPAAVFQKDANHGGDRPAAGAQQPSLLLPLAGGRRAGTRRANGKIVAAEQHGRGLSLSTARALAEMKGWAR